MNLEETAFASAKIREESRTQSIKNDLAYTYMLTRIYNLKEDGAGKEAWDMISEIVKAINWSSETVCIVQEAVDYIKKEFEKDRLKNPFKWTDKDMVKFADGWHIHALWLDEYRKDHLFRSKDITNINEFLSAFKNLKGKT